MVHTDARFDEELVYFAPDFARPGDHREAISELVSWDVYRLQHGLCTVCGELLDSGGVVDLHEALVTKGQVQGWPKSWRIIIINRYNCTLVHRSCHEHGDRVSVWKHKCDLFGEEELIRWYTSLPFRKPLEELWKRI